MAKEIDYITFNKKEKLGEFKSTILEDSSQNVPDDNIAKYANKMGHKKSIQRFKKGSNGNVKTTVNQYIKPRNTYRNQINNLAGNINSKTFIETHNFEKIDHHLLPSIGYEYDLQNRFEASNVKSQDR